MSELTNIHARAVKDLTTPTELPVDHDALEQVKLVAGNFPTEYAGNEALTVKQIKDLATVDLESKKANKTDVEVALSNLSTTANKFYPTLSEANSHLATMSVNAVVTIGEEANKGLWYKATAEATTLTKSAYDPLTQANNYTNNKAITTKTEAVTTANNYTNLVFDAVPEVIAPYVAQAEAAATAATISAGVFETPEAGVDPTTGVEDGEYFNVRSPSSDSYIDEYQNIGGSAVATGKSYPSSTAKWDASFIVDSSGKTQQEINDFGGAKWYAKSGGYKLGATVKLDNGDTVKSTKSANIVNPNIDMNGWVDATTGSKLNIQTKISTSSDFGDVKKASTKYLLSDEYSTLADAKIDFPFADNLSASLGWAILQKQFNETGSSLFELSAISGKFYVNRPLNFVGEVTKNVSWNLELLLDDGGAEDWAITFNVNAATHVGRIDLNCYKTDTFDNYDWSKRSWFNGIKCNRVAGGDFYGLTVNGRLKGRLFEVDGISHNANYFKIGALSGICGSINNSFTRNIVSKTNTGNHSSSDQRTVININTAIDFNIAESVIKIGSDYHIVTANTGSSITVYPHVSDASTSLSIFYGGILKTKGDNGNSLIIKQIRSFESANAYALDTAYGVKVEDFGTEFSGTGLQYGLNPDSIVGTLNTDLWYTEVNDVDIIDVTCENKVTPIVITAQSGLVGGTRASKVVKLAPIDAENKKVEGRNVNLDLPFGFLENSTELGVNKSTGYSVSGTVYHYFGTRKRVRVINDSAGITLAVDDKIKALGIFECEVLHTGSKHNGGVDFTAIVCEAPYTIFASDEVSQRAKYFPATAHPRKLIVRLHGTVFHVSDVSENSYKPYPDLSKDFGTGIVNADALITKNTGTGFGSAYNAVQSFKTNSDVFTVLNVDIAYSVNAQNRAVIRTRGRSGSTVSDWTALLNTAKFTDVTTLSGSETSAQIAAKLNEIIDLLKSNT